MLSERVFHFTAESLPRLKAKAKTNEESAGGDVGELSAFHSVSSHVWWCVTRAHGLPAERVTTCTAALDYRLRLEPPLPADYFEGAVWNVGEGHPMGCCCRAA